MSSFPHLLARICQCIWGIQPELLRLEFPLKQGITQNHCTATILIQTEKRTLLLSIPLIIHLHFTMVPGSLMSLRPTAVQTMYLFSLETVREVFLPRVISVPVPRLFLCVSVYWMQMR